MTDQDTPRPRRRLIRWVLGLTALAGLGAFSVTALASSGAPSTGAPARPLHPVFGAAIAVGGPVAEASPQFRDCLSAHGINPPPGPPAGASQAPVPMRPKDLPDPQRLQQAMSACKQYLPAAAQQKLAQMQAFQQCLSAHGAPPPTALRAPGDGANPPDPQKLQQAFSACRQDLPAGAHVQVAVGKAGPPAQLRQCLSAHGVNLPDAPGQPPSQPPSKATLQAAFQACRQYAPPGLSVAEGDGQGGVGFMTGTGPGPAPPDPGAGPTATS